ncbi:hypothetical protein O6H91_06G050900 [Diphasiastrum complanatum]|uniref:Uncharacterized protein n=1 Tax=Diphasiastrum complanatum TaxID=34168 RepID=A0ACC2DDU9_DIPCM|nr:hypothetical protein O6H91_06G050900 [Diphasiastrum complanatum]
MVKGTLGSCSGFETSNLLHSCIWSQLPEDIIRRILALLPLPSLFRMHAVCKRWGSFFLSPAFLHLCAERHSNHHWLLLPKYRVRDGCLVYDPTRGRWFTLSLNFLPCNFFINSVHKGSLVLDTINGSGTPVYICNPLTKALIKVPHFLGVRYGGFWSVLMNAGDNLNQSKLLILIEAGAGNGLSTLIYDFAEGVWKTAGAMLMGKSIRSEKIIVCNGLLFCITDEQVGPLNLAVSVYDPERQAWTQVPVPMKSSFGFSRLLECDQHIFILRGVKVDLALEVHLWKLEQASMQWIEQDMRIPDTIAQILEEKQHWAWFDCVGMCGIIYIRIFPEIFAYDLLHNQWTQLPHHPDLCSECTKFTMSMYNFHPVLRNIVLNTGGLQ